MSNERLVGKVYRTLNVYGPVNYTVSLSFLDDRVLSQYGLIPMVDSNLSNPTTVYFTWDSTTLKNVIQCCRCETICGPESPDRLTVPNVSKGGVIGAMARSNFLMTRRKVLKVKILRLENGHFQSIRSSNIWDPGQ